MSSEPTEADIQLVVRALAADHWASVELADAARDVLVALAEAGRLLPDDAEVEEEWTVAYTMKGVRQEADYGEVFDSRELTENTFEMWAKVYGVTDPVFCRRERLTAFGPWVAVDGTE